MNISLNRTVLENALGGIHVDFRDTVIDIYIELKKRQIKSFFSDEFDSVGISAGKFCETLVRFIQFELTKGEFIPFADRIPNFAATIDGFSKTPSSSGNESMRILIPRALLIMYTLRNKRGIGHVGGDIEANNVDISTIVKLADWIICELIRVYHNLSIQDAQNVVDSLNLKLIPQIWAVDGNKRILKTSLTIKEKVLILLYNELDNEASAKELFDWVEYSNFSVFKKKVLIVMHKEKLVNYNIKTELVKISPIGINTGEKLLLNN